MMPSTSSSTTVDENMALDKLTELAIIATDGPQSPLLQQPHQSETG